MPETATEPTTRTFSEEELVAITADRVTRETAELTKKVESLTSEKDEVAKKLDVEVAAREAAEKRATDAEEKAEKVAADVEAEKAALARKDERVAKIREAASHLTDKFFEDESRVARITAMSDEAFEGYLSDIRDTTTGTTSGTSSGANTRETAMEGDAVSGGNKPAPAASNFLMRPYVSPKGA